MSSPRTRLRLRRAMLVAGGTWPLMRALPAAADAQVFPWRPVTIVQPFGPGNNLDIYARKLAAAVAPMLGQPVIVDTRPGASGNIASDHVARALADGHTLLITPVGVTLQYALPGSHAVNPLEALAPVTRLIDEGMVVVVHPSLNVKTLGGLIALATAKPGALAFGTSGFGGVQHMAALILSQRAGVEMLHVPFPNSSQIVTNLLSGEVPVAFSFVGTMEPHLASGRAIALAVTSRQRMPSLPSVPTIGESGYAGYDVSAWAGITTTAGTPAATIERLHDTFISALGQQEVRDMFNASGVRIVGNTPAEFAGEMRDAIDRWTPIMHTLAVPAAAKPG
jgi:tripartite-type tricarboxylate transporter receptor subunit TctC